MRYLPFVLALCLGVDLDLDGDADQSDFGLLQRCMSPAVSDDCLACDFNLDNAVDVDDAAIFESCASSASVPVSAACTDYIPVELSITPDQDLAAALSTPGRRLIIRAQAGTYPVSYIRLDSSCRNRKITLVGVGGRIDIVPSSAYYTIYFNSDADSDTHLILRHVNVRLGPDTLYGIRMYGSGALNLVDCGVEGRRFSLYTDKNQEQRVLAQNCTFTGVDVNNYNAFFNAGSMIARNCLFEGSGVKFTAGTKRLDIRECRFNLDNPARHALGSTGVHTIEEVTFDSNIVNATAHNSAAVVIAGMSSADSAFLSITGNTFTGDFSVPGGGYGICVGTEDVTMGSTWPGPIVIEHNSVSFLGSGNGHAYLIGGGGDGAIVRNNRAYRGNIQYVLKGNDIQLTDNTGYGPRGIYPKGAKRAVITGNRIHCTEGVAPMEYGTDETGTSESCVATGNVFYSEGPYGIRFSTLDNQHQSDRNIYSPGTVCLAYDEINRISYHDLNAFWSSLGCPENDMNSVVIHENPFADSAGGDFTLTLVGQP